jgi:hypothetical protein
MLDVVVRLLDSASYGTFNLEIFIFYQLWSAKMTSDCIVDSIRRYSLDGVRRRVVVVVAGTMEGPALVTHAARYGAMGVHIDRIFDTSLRSCPFETVFALISARLVEDWATIIA